MTILSSSNYVIDALQLIIVIQSVSIPFTLAYAKGTAEQEFLDAVLSPKQGRIIACVLLLILTILTGYNVSKQKQPYKYSLNHILIRKHYFFMSILKCY